MYVQTIISGPYQSHWWHTSYTPSLYRQLVCFHYTYSILVYFFFILVLIVIENNQSGPKLKFVLVYNIIVILKISFKNFAIRQGCKLTVAQSPTASKISAGRSNINLRSSSWRLKFIHHSKFPLPTEFLERH